MHLRSIAPAQAALQVQHAGMTGVGVISAMPVNFSLTGCVRIGKAQFAQRKGLLCAAEFPLQLGGKLGQGNAGLLEDPGESHRTLGNLQLRLAAFIGQVEIQRCVFNPGPARLRQGLAHRRGPGCQRQAADAPARAERLRGRHRTLPAGVDFFYQAARCKAVDQLMRTGLQR